MRGYENPLKITVFGINYETLWEDMSGFDKPYVYPDDETPWLRKCRKTAVLQGFQNLVKTDLRQIYDKWKFKQ